MHKDNLVFKFSNEEFKSIVLESNSFRAIGKKLGFAHKPGGRVINRIKQRIKELNIPYHYNEKKINTENIIKSNKKRAIREKKFCSLCSDEISYDNKSGLCEVHYKENRNKNKLEHWLKTGNAQKAISATLTGVIRNYIYASQNNNCSICGINRNWNGKQLNFVLDHINGDASNDSKENLRLVCPNCDSQLDTFKSKNKNSKRTYRKKEE
jgi:hypothetical protein